MKGTGSRTPLLRSGLSLRYQCVMKSRVVQVRWFVLVCVVAPAILLCVLFKPRILISAVQFLKGRASVSERVAHYGPVAEPRLQARFAAAGVAYPPKSVVLLGLKLDRELRLFASDGNIVKQVAVFSILGASGHLGPKLFEGDQQVPEGFYRIESLNPNSLYHLSMRVNYPNEEDRKIAVTQGRNNLGGDIMIHGKTGSVGCIAIGDPAIEELFILAARIGVENVEVVVAPSAVPMSNLAVDSPEWLRSRYDRLQARIESLNAGP